jgi:acetyl-CoA decarbonylase/synthase complex subunit gamma
MLSGIEIFKLLPKTNCKECGFSTCLAFAMQLAGGKTELEKCPYVSDEAKEKLAEASAPPIRKVTVGKGERAFSVGEEQVLFRHEKRFFNPTAIGLYVRENLKEKIRVLESLTYERVGVKMCANFCFIEESAIDEAEEFADHTFCVASDDLKVLERCAGVLKRPLLYKADADNANEIADIAKRHKTPVVAKGKGIEGVIPVVEKLTAEGVKDIIIDTSPESIREALLHSVMIRRSALSKFRPLGFPTIIFPYRFTDNKQKEALYTTLCIAKYGAMVVLSDLSTLFPLLVLRLNIYTDPQRPMAIDEGIYEINSPRKDSPVLITTNFSLTYFIVSSEIEASKVPTYLLIKDTDGLSTLTAWSAGKFSGDIIAPFVKKCGIEEKVDHRRIVIPGYVASIKGELEEELSGWEVVVGPREASDIPSWLQSL